MTYEELHNTTRLRICDTGIWRVTNWIIIIIMKLEFKKR